MSLTGQCLCGSITWELAGDPIATAVCHCDHCQRQSGGAFSVNVVGHISQLTVNGELTVYGDPGDDETGTVHVERRFCGTCGSPIVSELMGTDGVIAMKAGTLDDKSGIQPTVEVWCEKRQPWVDLPGMQMSIDRE